MLVVCDTNVVISALLWDGPTSAIHRAWVEGICSLTLDETILAEYRRVLSYPKFGLSPADVNFLLENEVIPFGIMVRESDLPLGSWIPDDPEDDAFIRLALAAKADALVSGDRHILARRDNLPCRILTVAEFLEFVSSYLRLNQEDNRKDRR